ncbi:MAG: YncE family protein, partial [Thermoleophilia bacterium]|nr:YncE family protein [Thermoleophilia bacterium]
LARAAGAALAGGRVAEAERSVATGPAAPTMAYETLGRTGEEAPPIEPTAESGLPPVSDSEPTLESEALPRTRVDLPATSEEDQPAAVSAPRTASRGGRGPGLKLLLPIAALAAAAVIGVLVVGGGSENGADRTTTESNGPGGGKSGQPPVAKLEEGAVPGGELPVGVAVAGNRIFTADRTGSQILLGNAKTREGITAVPTRENPEDLIVDSGALWVTEPAANAVIRADIDLSNQQEISVGTDPNGIAAATDGTIFVTNFGEGDVSRIDPADPTVEAERIEIEATNPHGIAVADGVLWVTDRATNELIQYDLGSGDRNAAGVGSNPKGVAVSDGVVWVANADDGTVSLISEEDLAPIGDPVGVGGQPRAVDVFDGKVWVSNGDDEGKELGAKDGWVSVFDATTQKLIEKKLVVGGSPEGLGVGDGRVWVATGPEGTVRAIKPG